MKYNTEDIVKLRRSGLSYREILKKLGIKSLSTIKHHLEKNEYSGVNNKKIIEENKRLKKENLVLKDKIIKISKILN